MTRQVSDPPESAAPPEPRPPRRAPAHLSRLGIVSMLVLIGLLLTVFTGMLLYSLTPQAQHAAAVSATATARAFQASHPSPVIRTPTPTPRPGVTPTPQPPIVKPNDTANVPVLQLPSGRYLLYEQPYDQTKPSNPRDPTDPNSQQGNLFLVPLTNGPILAQPQVLDAPGYVYSQAAHPILTPSGQLLYSGDGIWLMDIFSGHAVQLATTGPNEVVTSLALSNDGKLVAWSTEPSDGQGTINVYAGPLAEPELVYQQSAENCPCLRVFSILPSTAKHTLANLLLTDSRGSHEAVQNGLWSLPVPDMPQPGQASSITPTPLLEEDPQQGPLLLSPSQDLLLYSTNEGQVPYPTDKSVPQDVAALMYANSLSLAPLKGDPPAPGSAQTILPEQHNLRSIAEYHWVTTPIFTPDEHTLIYVEFSSDAQTPYDRHSALYSVQISGSGSHLRVGQPKLLATSTSALLELGPWLDDHTITFYSDGDLFAMDTQSGATATLAMPGDYARVVAVMERQ